MDLRTTLNVLLRHVETLLNVDAANILLFSLSLQQFSFAAGRGFITNEIEGANVRLGSSFAGRVALERKTVVISDELTAQANRDFSRLYEKEGFVAYAGVPLIAKGQIKGVLEIYHRSAHKPEREWLTLLETLAGQAAIAIDNAVNHLERDMMVHLATWTGRRDEPPTIRRSTPSSRAKRGR